MARTSPDDLLFLPLGGSGEIGMNLNLYGYRGKWLMVDLGVTFADETLPGIDLIMPDPTWIEDRREDLVALVLTHAHEDHLGAVAHLWDRLECPVYATGFAASILARKLAEQGLEGEVPVHVFRPGDVLELGPFRVTSIDITHSTPESQALAIETGAGTILHTGDWKLDPAPLVGPQTDTAALRQWGDKGVLALVCDSTNVFTRGTSGSEAEVRENLIKLLTGRRGRIAVTTFASNVARLETLAVVAQTIGRHACLVGRSLHRFNEAARANGYLKSLSPFVDEDEAGFLPPDNVMYICTGCQGEPQGAMARIASGDHPHVGLDRGDLAVFSSRIIPGNERTLFKLHNTLATKGIEVITEKDAPIHVSGHPARDELAEMYRMIRPRISIPVHGEIRHLVEHAKLAREMQVPHGAVVANGHMLRLSAKGAELVEEVPAGRLILDGHDIVPLQGGAVQQRRKISFNGVGFAAITVDHEGTLLAMPKVVLRGVAAEDEEELEDKAAQIATREIERLSHRDARDDVKISEAAVRAIRRAVRDQTGRRPVVEAVVTRLSGAAGVPYISKGKGAATPSRGAGHSDNRNKEKAR